MHSSRVSKNAGSQGDQDRLSSLPSCAEEGEGMSEEQKGYKCNMCNNMGMRQNCKEHKQVHGHGMVHLKKEYKNGIYAWWLCNRCAEREQ